MEPSLTIAAATFALVASITPGPNNLLLASSGLAFGFRRTIPLIFGIETGFIVLLLGVAAGLGALFDRFPAAHFYFRIAATAYLLHLAWKLWRAGNASAGALEKPVGFTRGALFQLLNPKAWMATVGAVGAYTLTGPAYWSSVGVVVLAFVLMGLPSIALWAAFGASFRSLMRRPRIYMWVQRGMAVATALSCVLIFL